MKTIRNFFLELLVALSMLAAFITGSALMVGPFLGFVALTIVLGKITEKVEGLE